MKPRKKTVQVVTAVRIGGRSYRTAEGAARAFASEIWEKMLDRRSLKIGHAAHHDTAWYNRQVGNQPTETVNYQGLTLTVLTGHNAVQERAYRRSIGIFKKVLP